MSDLFAEAVDDRVCAVEFLLELAHARLVRLVAATDLVALALRTLVGLGQLADLALDRLHAATHRLRTHARTHAAAVCCSTVEIINVSV